MKKYKVELTKKQLEQLGIEIEPEFTYPLFKRFKNDGEIIKFTSMRKGTTVWDGNGYNKVGRTSSNLIEHTNSKWEDVAYDSEKDLWDKQPCECWDNMDIYKVDIYSKTISFYDAKNKCSYSTNRGERRGRFFDNYKPLPSDRYDEWILDAHKTLKDK